MKSLGAGVAVQAGQEIFLRWFLARPSSGSSPGVAIDNLTVHFSPAGSEPPSIATQPQDEAAGEGGFTSGYVPLEIRPAARALLKPGARVLLAVHCHQTGGGQNIDVGLVNVVAPKP